MRFTDNLIIKSAEKRRSFGKFLLLNCLTFISYEEYNRAEKLTLVKKYNSFGKFCRQRKINKGMLDSYTVFDMRSLYGEYLAES